MDSCQHDKITAWLVCLGVFIGTFQEKGIVKSLGVLLPELREQFETKTWVIGVFISMLVGVCVIICPFAGALSKRFTARRTVLGLAILSTIGLAAGSFATTLPVLLFSLILSGFSLGAVAVAIGEVQNYFDKQYGIAIGIVHSGTAVGVMVLPLLAQSFDDVYGWRGCVLLLCAIKAQLVITGILLRPVSSKLKDLVDIDDSLRQSKNDDANTPRKGEMSPDKKETCFNDVFGTIGYYFDLSLFENFLFIGLFIFFFGNGYCMTGWLIYLVPFAEVAGLSPLEAASISSYGGLGNLVGNLAYYPIFSKRLSDKSILFSSTFTTFCAFVSYPILARVSNNYIWMIIPSVLFGFSRGVQISCFYNVMKDGISEEQRTNAVTWNIMAQGFGGICSGFLSGWIFDNTGSYTLSFVILAAVSLVTLCPLAFKFFCINRFRYSSVSHVDDS